MKTGFLKTGKTGKPGFFENRKTGFYWDQKPVFTGFKNLTFTGFLQAFSQVFHSFFKDLKKLLSPSLMLRNA
jgi:hypothetical protein